MQVRTLSQGTGAALSQGRRRSTFFAELERENERQKETKKDKDNEKNKEKEKRKKRKRKQEGGREGEREREGEGENSENKKEKAKAHAKEKGKEQPVWCYPNLGIPNEPNNCPKNGICGVCIWRVTLLLNGFKGNSPDVVGSLQQAVQACAADVAKEDTAEDNVCACHEKRCSRCINCLQHCRTSAIGGEGGGLGQFQLLSCWFGLVVWWVRRSFPFTL